MVIKNGLRQKLIAKEPGGIAVVAAMGKWVLIWALIACHIEIVYAQDMSPRNGKTLPCHGTLRVLVIFAEMEYDVNPKNDPCVEGWYPDWKAGELPTWRDNFFSTTATDLKAGRITEFYAESSFNDFVVLGDYMPTVVTIKESEVKSVADGGYHTLRVAEKLSDMGALVSAHGYEIADFDLWSMMGMGRSKVTPSVDSPHKIDHVMFIMRNMTNLKDGNGRASPGSIGKICGFAADSYSIFGAYSNMPFNICRHEFTHLFLGDNNFHSGAGGEKFGNGSYQMGVQGMWSVIGAAFSSLMTCNAWDRHRLGWKPRNKQLYISCLNTDSIEVSADFNDSNFINGEYILRDFVTTGDAVRIKLPGMAANQYQQYLWIENHQTQAYNHSMYDRFQYEDRACVEPAVPGLYMFIQIDKDDMTTSAMYGGYAEYLRPLTARGNYDYVIDTNKVNNECVNTLPHVTYTIYDNCQNALTGNHSLEAAVINYNNDSKIDLSDLVQTNIEQREGIYRKHLLQYGSSNVAFRQGYNSEISMSTNPSIGNTMTCVQGTYVNGKQNVRAIHLSGYKIEILAQMSNGAIKVRIINDNNVIDRDVRWCADSIFLPLINSRENKVELAMNKVLLLDRGTTPTWPANVDSVNVLRKNLFTAETKLIVPSGCTFILSSGSKLIVDNESWLVLMPGAKIIAERGSSIQVKNNSKLVLNDAVIELRKGAKAFIRGKSNIVTNGTGHVHAAEKKSLRIK